MFGSLHIRLSGVIVDQHTENEWVRAQLQTARKMLQTGATDQALDFLQRLEQSHPHRGEVLHMRGIVLSRVGKDEQAEPVFRSLGKLLPDSRDAASDHANVLLNLGRADEALQELLRHVPKSESEVLEPDSVTFCFNLGRAYKACGQAELARIQLLQTLKWQPQHYGALLSLGDVHKALGEIKQAAECFRRVIELQPNDGTAWWSLSNLKSGDFSDQEFEQLQQLAEVAGSAKQKVFFEFALATAFEQRDFPDQAFTHYASGNRLKRQQEPWDGAGFSRWLEDIRVAMEKLDLPPRPSHPGKPRPVFLVSLPRSGSTLTEQILAAHSGVTAASELPWVPRLMAAKAKSEETGINTWAPRLSKAEWSLMGEDYMEYCRPWYEKTSLFTDKLPGNFPYVGAILAMLPDALIINVRREAMDVCWSCYRQLFISGSDFAYDLDDLASYWNDHRRFMAYWQDRCPDRVLSLDYEALVQDPEKHTRELLSFVGLPFEQACLKPHEAKRAVNTASVAQVRQVINTRGIGHWRKYEKHLGGLVRALEQNVSCRDSGAARTNSGIDTLKQAPSSLVNS
jgi:tetratricopeptide (TPR) repeat protein